MKPRTMNIENLRQKLLNAGRQAPTSDRVPLAFERRIMARIGHAIPLDPWIFWNRILWRFAGPCVALTLLAGAFNWFGQPETAETENFFQDLETVLYAPLNTTQDVW
jgi:hypothetical protein